jgi:hypothetical protein
MDFVLPGLMAVSIGLIHFFGEEIDEYFSGYSFLLASFSAGFTVSYFFIRLLPEVMANSNFFINNFFVLIGFSSLYIVEEFVYSRKENFGDIKYDFKEIHTLMISSYHFVIGIMLLLLSNRPNNSLVLFYLPVLIHTAVNSLAIREMHEEMLNNKYVKIIASFSSVYGLIFAYFVNMSETILYSFLGVIGGAFMYVVIHDALDPRKERPIGFILGLLTFLILLVSI